MKPNIAALALIAALAAGAIIGGPLLNADRHEQVSLSAILAWQTFAQGMKESRP